MRRVYREKKLFFHHQTFLITHEFIKKIRFNCRCKILEWKLCVKKKNVYFS